MVDKHGTETDRPLLYLPGLDGTGRLLFRQTDLNRSYRVLCQSYTQDRKTTYEELAEKAASRLVDEGINRPAVIVAESFGGAVGMTLALLHPEKIERLVLVNTFAWYPRRLLIRLATVVGALTRSKPSPAFTRRFRAPFFFSPDIDRDVRRHFWEQTADVPVRAFWRRACMIAKLDLRPRLAEIQTPTLVLVSPNDRVVPSKSGRELAAQLPHAELVEIPSRHAALVHPSVNLAELLDR